MLDKIRRITSTGRWTILNLNVAPLISRVSVEVKRGISEGVYQTVRCPFLQTTWNLTNAESTLDSRLFFQRLSIFLTILLSCWKTLHLYLSKFCSYDPTAATLLVKCLSA